MIDRRRFIRWGLAGLGALYLPKWPTRLARASGSEPHFFIQVVFQGGMDPSYLFDARRLALTEAGVIQNYLGREPTDWVGANGCRTLATHLTRPLEAFRERFSVINGVVMAPSFEGHPQNMNLLFAGDPFGGESFVPHLQESGELGGARAPLDGLISGRLDSSLSNLGSTVPLDPTAARKLVDRLRMASPLEETSPLYAHIRSRMQAVGQGTGAFSAGARRLEAAYLQAPMLSRMLQGLDLPPAPPPAPPSPVPGDPNAATGAQFASLAIQLFKGGVTRSAVFVYEGGSLIFDAHTAQSARDQVKHIGAAAESLASIFRLLAETPYDNHRSMLDVTTVMAASEFGRTLRQPSAPIDRTGTDHNPLVNTILLGGKGIRGGQVIGASDTHVAGEALSGAHLRLDPTRIKMMGRPFDFRTGLPREDLPEVYRPEDYLGASSVVNSVYSLFGVPRTRFRTFGRNLPEVPTVPGLLS